MQLFITVCGIQTNVIQSVCTAMKYQQWTWSVFCTCQWLIWLLAVLRFNSWTGIGARMSSQAAVLVLGLDIHRHIMTTQQHQTSIFYSNINRVNVLNNPNLSTLLAYRLQQRSENDNKCRQMQKRVAMTQGA